MYPLMDMVYVGDTLQIANNTTLTVSGVDYVNGRITVTSNLTANSNSLMSINRTLTSTSVRIYGTVGTTYTPELTDESGRTLLTEDGNIILLG